MYNLVAISASHFFGNLSELFKVYLTYCQPESYWNVSDARLGTCWVWRFQRRGKEIGRTLRKCTCYNWRNLRVGQRIFGISKLKCRRLPKCQRRFRFIPAKTDNPLSLANGLISRLHIRHALRRFLNNFRSNYFARISNVLQEILKSNHINCALIDSRHQGMSRYVLRNKASVLLRERREIRYGW